MNPRLTAARLSELGTAATVGIHVDGVCHVSPAELGLLVTELVERRADATMAEAANRELLNEIAVLRRHLAEREKQLRDLRATMAVRGLRG